MSAALNSLLQKASIEDSDEVLAHCDASLKNTKNDIPTLQVKVIALLKLNRFEDAIRVFHQAGDQLKEQTALEYAYTLYKTGDTSKAADVARGLDSRGGQHLRAQVVCCEALAIQFILTRVRPTDLKILRRRQRFIRLWQDNLKMKTTIYESI